MLEIIGFALALFGAYLAGYSVHEKNIKRYAAYSLISAALCLGGAFLVGGSEL